MKRLMALAAVMSLSLSASWGTDSPADFVLQKDRAGLVYMGMSRKVIPGNPRASTMRSPLSSMVVQLPAIAAIAA